MKTSEILNLKYDENKETFQKILHKIKPFENVEGNIPFEMLEKLISKYCRKYTIMPVYITPTYIPDEDNIYNVTLRNTGTMQDTHFIYAISMYELFAKMSIKIYSMVKNNEVEVQDWDKFKKEKEEKMKKILKGGK